MSALSYDEQREQAETTARYERTRSITEGWNGYLNDVAAARQAMPGHPVEVDVNHLVACRMALQAAWSHLDAIEEQLPASRTHVRDGIEDEMREQLTGHATFVGSALEVER